MDNDSDGVGNVCDNCLNVYNKNQTDDDDNLIGDACQDSFDLDSDGIGDRADNCISTPNGDQVGLICLVVPMYYHYDYYYYFDMVSIRLYMDTLDSFSNRPKFSAHLSLFTH